MTDFKRKFVMDKLLETLEYAAVRVTVEDVMGKFMAKGHIKVDDYMVRIRHSDTGFDVDAFDRCDIQTIQYDMTTDHSTIRLNIGR